ncbi:MAG TPA: hypothetical protein VFO78_07385 [Candidatus Limnocylindrales bacterium]|nr:hypothetical protein [Candidatus Limnocylindrales bacterium]
MNELERELRGALRGTLDRDPGPDRDWSASPAARRVAALERHRSRWPLRVLAAAALVGAGGAVALLAGAPKLDLNVRVEAANGWIAISVSQPGPTEAEEDLDIWLAALGQDARRAVGTDSDRLNELCPAFAPDGRRLAYGRVEGQGRQAVVENGVEVVRPATYRRAELAVADVSVDGRVSDPLTIPVGDGLPPPCPIWSPNGEQLAFGAGARG